MEYFLLIHVIEYTSYIKVTKFGLSKFGVSKLGYQNWGIKTGLSKISTILSLQYFQ
jgi:hypothetical protein